MNRIGCLFSFWMKDGWIVVKKSETWYNTSVLTIEVPFSKDQSNIICIKHSKICKNDYFVFKSWFKKSKCNSKEGVKWFLFLKASRSIIKCKNNVIVWDENKKKHLNHVLFEGWMLFSCLACQEGWHLFIIFKFHVVPLFIMTVFHLKLTKVS